MKKIDKALAKQLALYDKVVAQGRKRFIAGYFKYGDAYKQDDLDQEALEEILDLFNYFMMKRMKKK